MKATCLELPSRLLFVVNTAWFFLSHRLPIARALIQQGVDVHLAAPSGADLAQAESQGLKVHAIPLSRSGLNPLEELQTIGALARLYRQLRPELVHHVTPKPVLYGSIAARIAGVPSIVNAISGLGHAFVGNSAQALTMRAAASLLYRMAFRHPNAHIIFQNPSDRALLQRLVPTVADRNTLIPGSGVSLEAFTPSPFPAETLTVILAARLLRNKGIYEFVEAARRLRANAGLDVRMVLVGMPDPGNPTTVSDKDLHLWSEEGVIEWWGHQADMAEVLSRAHIFCLPSHGGEGVPKVILEAMASGRPVITTDVPGCRDAVEDGKTGLLIPPRDAASLVTAITMLGSDSQRRVALGAAGRQRAEALFSVDSVVEQHLAIYERLQLSLF